MADTNRKSEKPPVAPAAVLGPEAEEFIRIEAFTRAWKQFRAQMGWKPEEVLPYQQQVELFAEYLDLRVSEFIDLRGGGTKPGNEAWKLEPTSPNQKDAIIRRMESSPTLEKVAKDKAKELGVPDVESMNKGQASAILDALSLKMEEIERSKIAKPEAKKPEAAPPKKPTPPDAAFHTAAEHDPDQEDGHSKSYF